MRLGGVDLAALPIEQVRETVLVSDTGAHVFAGTLQDAVDPHGRLTLPQAEAALYAAAAEDVFDLMPGGWQGVLDERGRGLSGGQRQRLVLTRALAADAPVLVLVEPTSAVDAHTEARIAERLPEHRRGRTTVVMTASRSCSTTPTRWRCSRAAGSWPSAATTVRGHARRLPADGAARRRGRARARPLGGAGSARPAPRHTRAPS